VALSPDGTTVAASNQLGQIALWNADSRRLLRVLARPGSSTASSLAFNPSGDLLASGGAGAVSLWSLPAPPLAAGPYSLGVEDVTAVAFAQEQHRLAVAGNTGILQLCEVSNEVSCETLLESERPIASLALSQTGNLLALADSDGAIAVLNITDQSEAHHFQTDGRVESLAFSPDAARLAAGIAAPASPGSYDPVTGAILLWDLATGQETRVALDSPVASLAFHPNGINLVSGETGVVTWVATSGEAPELRQHAAGEAPIRAVAINPNGALIAAAGDGVFAWSARTGEVRMQEATESPAVTIAFSPDGRTLASGHADGTILFWDPAAFTRFGSLGVLPAPVASLNWTNAETLLAVDTTGSAFTFTTNPWSWIPAACQAMAQLPPAATPTPTSTQPTGPLCGPPIGGPPATPIPTQ
jgi:WD40 repeat protein